MARYGYGRVSTRGQRLYGNSLQEQKETLLNAGVEEEHTKYVQGEFRFTYQGRMMIEREFPVRTYCKPAGERIKWEFGGE